MKNFKILTSSEEKKLTNEELKLYYSELRKNLKDRKLTNTTPGATTISPKCKKITNKLASKLIDVMGNCKNVVKESDGQENIPDGPVIFAHTHQGLLDNFVWIPATPRHAIALHSKKVKKFVILIQLNTGLVLVSKDPKNVENRQNAKLDMITLTLNGHSLSYFPENTFNLSPNKLHLPMSHGFLDVARKAGIPVVPVVDEYTYDSNSETEKIVKVHTRFGKPIYINEDDDILEKLAEYQESVSTMRWDLIAEKGLFKREDISNQEYINFVKGNIKNIEWGGTDVQTERRQIFSSNDEFYKFHYLNDVEFSEFGELLDTEEVRRLKLINYKNNI